MGQTGPKYLWQEALNLQDYKWTNEPSREQRQTMRLLHWAIPIGEREQKEWYHIEQPTKHTNDEWQRLLNNWGRRGENAGTELQSILLHVYVVNV